MRDGLTQGQNWSQSQFSSWNRKRTETELRRSGLYFFSSLSMTLASGRFKFNIHLFIECLLVPMTAKIIKMKKTQVSDSGWPQFRGRGKKDMMIVWGKIQYGRERKQYAEFFDFNHEFWANNTSYQWAFNSKLLDNRMSSFDFYFSFIKVPLSLLIFVIVWGV